MPTIKVDRLLDAVGESVVQTRRLEHALGSADVGQADESTEWEMGRGKLMLAELQRAAIDMRTLRLGSITGGYPRAVRDMALTAGREVSFEIRGGETQLDRVILDGITDTIAHLLRNAVAHGIEAPEERELAGKPRAGRIVLRAEQRGSVVAIEVTDDGRGVAPAVAQQARQAGTSLAAVLCEPGFSTTTEVTDVAGRGVGLDSVRADVESFGGSLEIESAPERGTVTTMLLPYSIALMQVLLVERAGQVFGLPLASVEETSIVERSLALAGSDALEVRGHAVALCDLAMVLGWPASPLRSRPRAVIVSSSGHSQAITCDQVLGEQEVVLKSLGALLAGVPGYLGAAIIDDGAIAPILDPAFLTRRLARRAAPTLEVKAESPARSVLVVDDQFTVRELQRGILEAAGYRVLTGRDGRDACRQIADDPQIELVVTDLDMPEMDGIELLQTIRQDPRRSSLPVVVLTSRASEADKRRGMEAGADAYIAKDEFDQRTLLDTVERLLVG